MDYNNLNLSKLNDAVGEHNKYDVLAKVATFFLVATCLGTIIFFIDGQTLLGILSALALVLSMFIYGMAEHKRGNARTIFYEEYNDEVLEPIFSAVSDSHNYESDSGFSFDYISDLTLFDNMDIYRSNDWLTLSNGSQTTDQARIHIQKEDISHDSKGRKKVKHITMFDGTAFLISYNPADFSAQVRSKKLKNCLKFPKNQILMLEKGEFNDNFQVISAEDLKTLSFLNFTRMEGLMNLQNLLNNKIGLVISHGVIIVFVNSITTTFNTNVRKISKRKYEDMQFLASVPDLIKENLKLGYSTAQNTFK